MDNNQCQEFIESNDDGYTYVLEKGTILYSGNAMDKSRLTIDDIFGYVGQRNIKTDIGSVSNFVLYASSDINTALGYAMSCLSNVGYVHKFRVNQDVLLLRGDTFEDAEIIDECVCGLYDKYSGYMVLYGYKDDQQFDEFALCNSENYLDYIESLKCEGEGKYTTWTDIINE